MSGIGKVFKRKWRRPDGTFKTSDDWSISFPYQGRTRVEGTQAQTEAEAWKILRQRLEEIGRSEYMPGRRPTVREAATDWLNSKKVSQSKRGGPVKDSTFKFWENHVTHYILPVLGDYRLDRVDTRMIEKARDIWKEGNNGRSVNKILGTLQAIYKKQIALSVLRFNPVEAAERLAMGTNEAGDTEADLEVSPEEVYSPDELRRLIESAKPGLDQTLIATAALTMMRHGELLALHWQDIDLEAKEITIRRSWGGQFRDGKPVFWIPKTKSSVRKVPIPDQLVALFRRWDLQNRLRTNDLVFANTKAAPLNRRHAFMAMRSACLAAGLTTRTVHALRHTGASIHLMAGTQLPEVSAMLGHSNVNITLTVYTHFIPKMRTDSAARLAEAVFGNQPEEKARK